MWWRNLVFIAVCVCGAGALAANLLTGERISAPQGPAPARPEQNEIRAVAAKVDSEFHAHWRALGLDHAPQADDLTIARRLSLGLTGTIPSLEEVRALQAVAPDRRIEWWVDHLLNDRRYADYTGERLARTFVGTEGGQFVVFRRRRFVTWLSDRLHENNPQTDHYDDIVRQLISDKGLWTDHPAVNFITATVDNNDENQPDPVTLAGRTTRAFLGMRIDCLQCHDDRLGNVNLGTADNPRSGTQQDFHRLAAFYAEANNSLLGIRDNPKEYEYQYLDAEEEVIVPPVTPFLTDIAIDEATRRDSLAAWITHKENKPFARAAVNRFWALLFGRPLVEPIDDIPLYGDLPPGMETLAADFVAHDYDIRRLLRVIAATEVFQLDSRAVDFEPTEEHENAWAVFPLSRLRPEQVAGAVIQSSSLSTIDANAHIIAQISRFAQQNEFVKRYGDMGEDEFTDRGGTIPQRLLLMNGDLLKERTNANPLLVNAASRIAGLSPTNEKAIETAYLTVLTRLPTDGEQAHFVSSLADTENRLEQLEDIYWTLLNSSEFSWNH